MSDPDPQRGPWQQRLAFIIDTVRELSAHTDPQALVENYAQRIRQMYPIDARVSLSRRNLAAPDVRITRASIWGEEVNPWKQKDNLVIHHGGLFSQLIYADEPTIIDDLKISPDDPAAPFVQGMRSLLAIPLYDGGHALNMIVTLRRDPNGFDRESVPERVWMSNLFGRATQTLVLAGQLREAYEELDREMKVVGDIQRSLLPRDLPEIAGVELAVHYQTSTRAGGDYYDFFPLSDGRWGILIGDVSGHGTPAAVLMAVTHSIAHAHAGPPAPPSRLMNFVNHHLAARYTGGNGTFVTAFYGIFDPSRREMIYASAGHWPPRVRRRADAQISSPFTVATLPLGIDPDEVYVDGRVGFDAGDLLVFYTDGITEARESGESGGEMFGVERLDAALAKCPPRAGDALGCILEDLGGFTGLRPPADDQTILVAAIR